MDIKTINEIGEAVTSASRAHTTLEEVKRSNPFAVTTANHRIHINVGAQMMDQRRRELLDAVHKAVIDLCEFDYEDAKARLAAVCAAR